jgi:hypothetical protein
MIPSLFLISIESVDLVPNGVRSSGVITKSDQARRRRRGKKIWN